MVDFFSHWFLCSETFLFPIRGISGWKDSSMRGALRCAITEPHVFLVLSNTGWTQCKDDCYVYYMQLSYIHPFSIQFMISGVLEPISGHRQGTPSTGCQSVTGLTHKDTQPFTLIPTDNSNHQLAKPHACLWIVGGSWNESAQRKGSRLDSNPGPFHWEVTLLTTVARLLLPQVFTHIYKTNTSLCDFYFPSLLCFSCRSFSQWYMFVIASTH